MWQFSMIFRGRKLIINFFLKDVANEIMEFEALLKKDLQAKERWDVNYFNNHKTTFFLTCRF